MINDLLLSDYTLRAEQQDNESYDSADYELDS